MDIVLRFHGYRGTITVISRRQNALITNPWEAFLVISGLISDPQKRGYTLKMGCHSSLIALFWQFEKVEKKPILQTCRLQNTVLSLVFLSRTKLRHEFNL